MEYPNDEVVPDYVPLENRGRWRELWTKTRDQALLDGDDEALAEVKGYVEADSQFGPNATAVAVVILQQEKAMKQTFKKFIRFVKVEAADNGACIATGIATSEAVDSEDERCHYETTKPWYQKWSDACAKRSKGKSLGNVREQHDAQKACGKLTAIDYQDEEKQIFVRSRIVDPLAAQKCLEGVYTGWSHGGRYIKQWTDTDGNHWYTASPSELSAVDNPSNPEAAFADVENIDKAVFLDLTDTDADGDCQYVEKNGSTELVSFAKRRMEKSSVSNLPISDSTLSKLADSIADRLGIVRKEKKTKRVAGEDLGAECFAYVGDKDDTSTWKLPYKGFSTEAKNKSHVRNALARFSQTQGIPEGEKAKVKAKLVAAAKKHGIEVSDDSDKAVRAALTKIVLERNDLQKVEADEFVKGMYQVSSLAQILQDLQWMVASSEYERDYEGDDSAVPEDLRTVLEDAVSVFIAMATEEAKELLTQQKAASGGTEGGLSMKEAFLEFCKKAKGIFGKMAKSHDGTAAAFNKAADHHNDLAEHHMAAGEACADKAEQAEFVKGCEKIDSKLAKADQNELKADALGKALEKSKNPMAVHHSKMAKCHAGMAKSMQKAAGHEEDMADHCEKADVAISSEKDNPSGAGANISEGEKEEREKAAKAELEKAEKEKKEKEAAASNDPILKAIQAIDTKIEANKTELEKQVADLKKQLDDQIEKTPIRQTNPVGRNGNEISKTAVAEADDSGL